MDSADWIILADRLRVPARTRGLLWDMDGTVLDTIGLDFDICNVLLKTHVDPRLNVGRDLIRELFAFEPWTFWRHIVERTAQAAGIEVAGDVLPGIVAAYEEARLHGDFHLCVGVEDILVDAKRRGIALAVVSNNATADVRHILQRASVDQHFDAIIGNDGEGIRKKPEPDSFLLAARTLGISADHAVVLEDSLIGAEAGRRAGAFTVAVATGGTTFDQLQRSGFADVSYVDLGPMVPSGAAASGGAPRLSSPDGRVTALLEQLFMGAPTRPTLAWKNDDWQWLGEIVGRSVRASARTSGKTAFTGRRASANFEVELEIPGAPALELYRLAAPGEERSPVNPSELPEESGTPVALLRGVMSGLPCRLRLAWSADGAPAELWAQIFRAVGSLLTDGR